MDQDKQQIDVKEKEEIKKILLNTIISGLESKQLTLEQMKASANYILDNLTTAVNYSQLMVFLENLQKQWPIFSSTYMIYKNKFHKDQEKLVIDKLSKYINNIPSS